MDGDQLASRQAGVLEAAGKLLAEKTSADITVEQLIQSAGTSRPTFYRWFPDGIEQVLDMLIARANQDLMLRIISVVDQPNDLPRKIEAGIQAYFDWGKEMGPVTYGIYREGFDESSPAWKYRQQTLTAINNMMSDQANELGFDYVSDLAIETLVGWVESAGATLFRNYPVSAKAIEDQRWLTTQMALSMLETMRKRNK